MNSFWTFEVQSPAAQRRLKNNRDVTTDKHLTASERASITSWQADSASAARPDPISHGGKRRSERPPAEVQKQQSDKHDAQKHPAADEETDGEETTDMLTMLMLVRHC